MQQLLKHLQFYGEIDSILLGRYRGRAGECSVNPICRTRVDALNKEQEQSY